MDIGQSAARKKRTTGSVALLTFALAILSTPAPAQTPTEPELADLVRECQTGQPGPFRSVDDIRREVDCVSARANASQASPRKVISPSVSITSRRGEWEYRYRLNGAISPRPACVVTGALVLPQDIPVEIRLTSDDAIHAFRLPALGISMVAVPGRIATQAFRAEAAADIEAFAATDQGAARERSVVVPVRIVSQDAYASWERTALRDRGCIMNK